jgi:hypothetical protein
MLFVLKFLFVMVLMGVADVCWTMYFIKVQQKDALRSAMWSSMIVVCGIITTIFYVEDHWLGLASIIGAFVGTYLTVKYKTEVPKT